MKSAKVLVTFWLFFRIVFLFVGLALYEISCPIRIDPWILWVIALFLILEPLFLLLVVLLNDTTKSSPK